MEEWSVAGSGSEEDEESATNCLDFGGIKIPPHRLLHLMQSVHIRKTVELDSLGGVYRSKRQKKKKKRKKSTVRLSGGESKTVEDASETASDIRSTTCTSTTATESRDMRRRKYDPLFDDPELDNNDTISSSSKLTKIKKAPPPIHKKEIQLARLDKITAEKMKRKQRWDLLKSQSELSHSVVHEHLNSGPEKASQINVGKQLVSPQNRPEEEAEEMEVDGQGTPIMTFDDEESTDRGGSESDSDMKFSLLPQINKVEQLLDFDVS